MRSGLAAAIAALGLLMAGAAPASAARPAPEGFADVVEALTPAVVNISSAQSVNAGAFPADSPLSPYNKKFNRQTLSLGSGFIIDPTGIVVTNNHVVEGATEIKVTLSDGREFDARLRGRDEETDLAVLQIEGGGKFPSVKFGDSRAARVGDWVVAIGNPFGLGGSVTVGIISAINRDIQAGQYDDFIQTDAAINRGNSGGPLFNLDGDVVGVNTAIYSQTGGSVGVGFAVPSELVSTVVDQLIRYGETRRGWLGVNIEELNKDEAAKEGLAAPNGAVVSLVRPESPAATAGLQAGDVIVSFNGKQVKTGRDLTRAVAETAVGSTVPVEVVRDGRHMKVRVKLGRREENRPLASLENQPAGAVKTSGLILQPPTPEVRARFNLPESVDGVVVTAVDPDSPAAAILKPGDVILEIGWERVNRPEAAADKMSKLRNFNSGPVQIYVRRGELLFYELLRP